MSLIKNCTLRIKQWHFAAVLFVFCAVVYLLLILRFESTTFVFPRLFDDQTRIANPKVNTATSLIRIYGEEQHCAAHRYKTAVVMGLYNTGTNILLDLLLSNCWPRERIPDAFRPLFRDRLQRNDSQFEQWRFKSIFGITKHQPSPSMEYMNSSAIDYEQFMHEQLHVVAIKDPLTWMKSICKQPYYIQFIRDAWFRSALCPFQLSANNGTASANQWHSTLYPSLLETWNRYYESWLGAERTPPQGSVEYAAETWRAVWKYAEQKYRQLHTLQRGKRVPASKKEKMRTLYEYLMDHWQDTEQLENEYERVLLEKSTAMRTNSKAPAIVVRFEDVLFHPELVVDRICECVRGFRRNETVLREQRMKPHGESRNRSEALAAYSNASYRYQNYGALDIAFLNRTLNHSIAKLFGYELSADMRPWFERHEYSPKMFYHSYVKR